MTEPLWHVHTFAIDEFVRAADQFEAWDTLRDRPLEEFGLVVTAEPDESGDPIFVRTSQLMFKWGREEDALATVAHAVANGLPDTADVDRKWWS